MAENTNHFRQNNKLKFIAMSFCVLGLACLGLAFYLFEPPSGSNIISGSSTKLTKEQFEQKELELTSSFNQYGPTETFNTFAGQIAANTSLARDCHRLLHAVGHEAYEIYGSFAEAIRYETGLCNSGYTHGIIEMNFTKTTNINATVATTCPGQEQKFKDWQCFHGIGHGAMYYTKSNLDESLKLCEFLHSDFAKYSCNNGVFMDYFINTNHDGSPKTQNLTDINFCSSRPELEKADCFFYAPTAHLDANLNDFSGVFRWCEGAEEDYKSTCFSGAGSQIIKDNVTKPAVAKEACELAPKKYENNCIGGAVGLYINHFGKIEPAKKLCQDEFASYQSACENAISSRLATGMFN